MSEQQRKLWTLHVYQVGSLILTNVPLWGLLIMGEDVCLGVEVHI